MRAPGLATLIDFISKNYEWLFSGLGVFIVGGFLAGLGHTLHRKGQNHPDIAVHAQSISLHARDYHETYDHALGIFIANTGDTPIHIRRALFKNRVAFLSLFTRRSRLPVYPRAFKDAERDAYELKFGDQWYDPQTDIPPRGRVMTYLPLSEEVANHQTNRRKHGEVVLRYSAGDASGVHRVFV